LLRGPFGQQTQARRFYLLLTLIGYLCERRRIAEELIFYNEDDINSREHKNHVRKATPSR
jgi:hypothetical protein